jgi:hypothetical protein
MLLPANITAMRRIFLCSVFLIISALVCGCTQPVPPQVPSTPAVTVATPETTGAVHIEKQIDINAVQNASQVVVQYNGGRDAADLVTLRIRINNRFEDSFQRTINNPVAGAQYVFTYQAPANAQSVNIVGVFRDGTEQTVLMAYP